jgi:KaiC/GvpD/RAD55 family RecA-like ATPase
MESLILSYTKLSFMLTEIEHVSTGFPELDKILEKGIVRPSCICINCEFNTNQRDFVYELIFNLLKNGLKGLYICLDRPANEIRNHFGRLGLNIDPYDEDYRLFFVDFFSESQKALIETSTLNKLGYQPNQLLETVGPFLDWIKNGFIFIDSVSTLTLNMNEKEAYEFVRGIKLLGRAFNLITLGMAYVNMADQKILDLVSSNADGNLIFRNETLLIDHFDNTNVHNEVLTLKKNDEERVTLNSIIPKTNKKISTCLLSLLDKNPLKINPLLTLETPKEYNTAELIQSLKEMEQEKTVKATPNCSSVSCPHCNSQTLQFYLQCPECESQLLKKGHILEHFSCGNIDFESNYRLNLKLVCPKCSKELNQIGVDYRKIGTGYQCTNKHLFSRPKVVFACVECKEKFGLDEAKLENQYTYELTEKGKSQAQKTGYINSKICQ